MDEHDLKQAAICTAAECDLKIRCTIQWYCGPGAYGFVVHIGIGFQAKEETEEAIKEGNLRYSTMVNERMNKEDQLRRCMESLKLEVASKESSVKSLQDAISKQEAQSAETQARQQKAWEEERRAAAVQQEQV